MSTYCKRWVSKARGQDLSMKSLYLCVLKILLAGSFSCGEVGTKPRSMEALRLRRDLFCIFLCFQLLLLLLLLLLLFFLFTCRGAWRLEEWWSHLTALQWPVDSRESNESC